MFAFDKGYSLFVLTKAAGGEFYDLAGEKTDLAFCPLREIDSDADLTWAVTWLEDLCSLNGLIVTPKHRNALTQALLQLRLSPSRTLTELSANVQDLDVREALQFYTLSGPLGQLLDADEDVLTSGRFLTFETENLLQLDDKAVIPVLLYLFRRIEKRLDGSPTLVSLDEAWAYLRNDVFRERLRDWLKTLRRMNGIVLLATQNLSDICNSDISDVILEMCPTKILLPNGEAKNPASKEFYDRVGLNSRELDILQTSIPKQHYYVISPLGAAADLPRHSQRGALLRRRERPRRTATGRRSPGGTCPTRGRASGSAFAPEHSKMNAWKVGPTITTKSRTNSKGAFHAQKHNCHRDAVCRHRSSPATGAEPGRSQPKSLSF